MLWSDGTGDAHTEPHVCITHLPGSKAFCSKQRAHVVSSIASPKSLQLKHGCSLPPDFVQILASASTSAPFL